MRIIVLPIVFAALLPVCASAKQKTPPASCPPQVDKPVPGEPQREKEPTGSFAPGGEDLSKLVWDMKEESPVTSHGKVTAGGKTIHYTATAGRLPIKDPAGGIQAEMFYVAYTQDGADPAKRPLTFAFNGGPGSASVWLHMGALGPRKVVLEKEGWMPQMPYRLTDNSASPLDKTDLVLVDAVGTGYSRAADMKTAKKFWGLKGDAASFGELIRLYITRNQRWSSPLYLLGESYGTTRAAEVAGFLADRGIAFKGIVLLSMVLDFQTLQTTRANDLAYELTLPTYTMIAMYHRKLPPDLMQDAKRTREEAVKFATGEYAAILAKGDALSPEERRAAIAKIARYTGLDPRIVDWASLRIDVGTFTHYLLADRKLRVGRLDGRYTGVDPEGFMRPGFYDPSSAAITGPITSVFNDYVRSTLGYATDMPYYLSAGDITTSRDFRFWRSWEWGPAAEGFPDTAKSLRAAMAKNPHMKVLVMEGFYDLATPFAAADYTLNHLDLPPDLRKNLSVTTYDSGHMVYLRADAHAKFHDDLATFIGG